MKETELGRAGVSYDVGPAWQFLLTWRALELERPVRNVSQWATISSPYTFISHCMQTALGRL